MISKLKASTFSQFICSNKFFLLTLLPISQYENRQYFLFKLAKNGFFERYVALYEKECFGGEAVYVE